MQYSLYKKCFFYHFIIFAVISPSQINSNIFFPINFKILTKTIDKTQNMLYNVF